MIVFKPSRGFAVSHPAHLVAFGFGAGLSPWAPGTMGTLVAWPVGWFFATAYPPAVLLGLIAALFVVGVWACGVTGRRLGVHDHHGMVWDEIVAFLLILAVLPHGFFWQLAGFVAFRFFDILKPPPIRWFERRYVGGFGVMGDDILAAGYALLVLAVAKRALL
jgi:phosphatidylglycerophosphatase A